MSSYVRHVEEVNSSTTQNTALDSSSHKPLSYIPQSDTLNDFAKLRNLNLSPSKMPSLEYKTRQEKDTVDLNNISPEVAIRGLSQTQDSQNSKGDFYCMNANDNPKQYVPLIPLIELKEEDSYMSNSNCGYITEENAIGHGNLIANKEHDQPETSSSYEIKTELTDSNKSFSGSSGEEMNGGYVTEENFRVPVNIAEENSATSTGYNGHGGGYVTEQELLNCNNNSDEGSGISGNEGSSSRLLPYDHETLVPQGLSLTQTPESSYVDSNTSLVIPVVMTSNHPMSSEYITCDQVQNKI